MIDGNFAGESAEQTIKEIAEGYTQSEGKYLYQNPKTGYCAVFFDEVGILTFGQQQLIGEQICRLTDFGNIGVISGNDPAMTNYEDYRKEVYRSLFGYRDGTIFSV